MARCECQATKGKQYEQCSHDAKYINSWGWLFCEEHRSVSDILLKITDKKSKLELVKRLRARRDMNEEQRRASI